MAPTLQLRKARDTQIHIGICTHTSKVALKGWQLSRMYSSVIILRRFFLKWNLLERKKKKVLSQYLLQSNFSNSQITILQAVHVKLASLGATLENLKVLPLQTCLSRCQPLFLTTFTPVALSTFSQLNFPLSSAAASNLSDILFHSAFCLN